MTNWYERSFHALAGGLSPERQASLEALIQTWEASEPRPTPVEIRKYVLPVLSNYKDPVDAGWEQARPGFLSMSDTVRVRKDAFDDGRFAHVEARVTAIRRGVISLKALDPKDASVEDLSYKITQLDKRVAH